MYALDLTFRPAAGASSDDLLDQAMGFVGDARRSGQCCGPWPLFVELDEGVTCRVSAPAEDALDPRHDSAAVAEHRRSIALDVRLVGEAEETSKTCACDAPAFFALFTTFILEDSPLTCGECWGAVPMYTIPSPAGDGDHQGLLFWAERYRDLDGLYMGSGVGEGFAYAELSRRGSRFMTETLELCAAYEKAAKRPVYAYVNRVHGAEPDACPECGGAWTQRAPAAAWTYRCEPCRILLPSPSDTRPPPAP